MKMLRVLAVAVACVSAAAPAFAQAPDISGRWNVVFTSPQGPLPDAPMELRKDGDKWVGTLYTQQGNADIEVTVKEKVATFHLPPFQTPNGPIQLAMSGTVNGDTMAGTLSADAFQLDWSAKRTGPAPGQEQKPTQTDLSGTWALDVTTAAGSGTPTVVLKQDGEKLHGQYSGQLGEHALTGTIKGNEFTFSFSVTIEGNTGTVIYSGTADGGTMKGTVNLGEMGQGTFSGRKK